MSTETRLDAYKTAELEILQAQEIRGGDRTHRLAELQEVRKAIKDLELQLARESQPTGRSMRFSLANMSRE